MGMTECLRRRTTITCRFTFILLLLSISLFDGFTNAAPAGGSGGGSKKKTKVEDPNTVPGCPDLDVLESEMELAPDALDNLLLCFCKVTQNPLVSISCLYGSSLEHLKKASQFVKDANKTIDQISIQHMEFPDDGIPKDLFSDVAPKLRQLEIRECTGQEPLGLHTDSLKSLESSLKNLTIHGCFLTEIPDAIDNLANLETLDLSDNRISNLTVDDFAKKSELKYLDVSSNFINHVEEDAFKPLTNLENLLIGDHNYMNETVIEEIGKVASLKTLDFSRADGIFSPPSNIFGGLPNLEILKLSGCSIETVEAGAFNQLGNLEQLDLRVNLIANITPFAFDGLKKLKRLSVAGNYIREIDNTTWEGLSSLEDMDIGWNEISRIPEGTFKPLSDTLEILNLRHNPLTEVDNVNDMKKLRVINLSECEKLKELGPKSFKKLPSLEVIDITRGNLTKIHAKAFSDVKKTVKELLLEKAQLTGIPAEVLSNLPQLEHIDLSGNPFICDDKLGKFITAIQDRYKKAARDGKDFLLSNQNETICDRPYPLRGEPVFSLDVEFLDAYDAKMDTTTVPSTTTESADKDEETTTKMILPDIFVGAKSNESIFQQEAPREVYDLSKADNAKHDDDSAGGGMATPITIAIIGLLTAVALLAVVIYMKKKRKISDAHHSVHHKKEVKKDLGEDGMVEIELDRRSEGRGGRRDGGR